MGKIIIVGGVMPPPISGQNVAFKKIYDWLSDLYVGKVVLVNLSGNSSSRTVLYKLIKAVKSLFFPMTNFIFHFFNKEKYYYLTLDSGYGLYFDAFNVFFARVFKFKIIIHHHSYCYLNKKTFLLSFINLIVKRGGAHIFLCNKMKREMEEVYGDIGCGYVISNSSLFKIPSPSFKKEKKNKLEFVLGFLSNITIEKGFIEVMDAFYYLMSTGVNVQLLIAGPILDSKVESYIREKKIRDDCNVKFLGLIGGDEKQLFFNSLDLFLFPTKYRNEAEPIVIYEALSYGVPVVARGRGCISDMVDMGEIYVVDNEEDFNGVVCDVVSNCLARRGGEDKKSAIQFYQESQVKKEAESFFILKEIFGR